MSTKNHIVASDNVFTNLVFNPAEAAVLKMRADLMITIEQHLRAKNLTQTDAAKLLGVTQARVSELMSGKFNKFSLDMLVKLAERAGLHCKLMAA